MNYRQVFILSSFLFFSITGFSQASNTNDTYNTELTKKHAPTYKLFKTQNIYTFIKLNTGDGRMWQVQYDIEGNNRFDVFLNMIPLAFGEDEIDGRFTLYPTENMWTFILLDTHDGRTWQVQWSLEEEDRLVIPID